MGRRRRYITSKKCYEIVFRAKNSMPFPCTDTINSIIRSVLGRVQRDNKVIIHHFIFEVTHAHILCTALSPHAFKDFYCQLKKQLTDAIKLLTGRNYLNLWEDRANVSIIPTLEDMIKKITYVLSNPSNDGLVNSIKEYPGVSSWEGMMKSSNKIDYKYKKLCPWIRLSTIKKIPKVLSRTDDILINEILIKKAKISHTLEIEPNSWIKAFIKNPTKEQIEKINFKILNLLKKKEEENKDKRQKENKTVMGIRKLRLIPLLNPHTPKKRERKIFVQSMFKEVRIKIIKEVKKIDKLCKKIYEHFKKTAELTPWPPGVYPPALPPIVSKLGLQNSYP